MSAESIVENISSRYIEAVERSENCIISPRIKFSKYNSGIGKHLKVECKLNYNRGILYSIFVYVSRDNIKSSPDSIYLGECTYDEYCQLEDLIDESIVEYRRDKFKKISRAQRKNSERGYDYG